jgi:hypothetical protein
MHSTGTSFCLLLYYKDMVYDFGKKTLRKNQTKGFMFLKRAHLATFAHQTEEQYHARRK